jgi:hypothetical protein
LRRLARYGLLRLAELDQVVGVLVKAVDARVDDGELDALAGDPECLRPLGG